MKLERKNGKTTINGELQAVETCTRLWNDLQLSDGHALDIEFGRDAFRNRMALYLQFREILLGSEYPEFEIRT